MSLRRFLVVPAAGLALLVTPSIRMAQQPDAAKPAAPAAEKHAEDVFKNIKVLKGISPTELHDAMEYFTVALGVGCDGCHVFKGGPTFDLDEKKEKATARKMIAMTMAINKDNFEGRTQVGCATCHQGHEHPSAFPPMVFGAPKPQRPERAPAGVTAAALVQKYVQQLGGEEALRKVTTRVAKGTVTWENGRASDVEVTQKAPDKYVLAMTTPNGPMTQGFNGTEGWVGGRGIEGVELDRLRRDSELFPGTNLKQKYPQLMLAGIASVGDRKAFILAGRDKGVFDRYFFDTETGLLVRRIVVHRTLLGALPEQTDYADYREVDGVKVPFTVTRQEVGTRWVEKYSEVKFGVPADDAKFTKPLPPPHP